MLISKPIYTTIILVFYLFTNYSYGQHKDSLQFLQPHSVVLEGYINESIYKTIDHWSINKVPYDQLVSFFSKGRPKFASGEMWGKSVRAASMFYRYTNDNRLKEILDKTVTDLLATEKPNGSISCSPIDEQPEAKGGDIWERKYVLLGLERYYSLVNKDEKVLQSMIRQVDVLISQIGSAPKTPITEVGWSSNNIEASTILEPVMRIYQLTHEKRFLEFAKYLVDQGGTKGFNLIEEALQNMEPHKMAGGDYPKAYDMLSFFEGLTEYYRVTRDEEIKQAILNFYKNVAEKEITIVGNGGNDLYHSTGECWGDTAFEQTNPEINRMMETCVGVTWLKFCSQVARLTGDPTVFDMIEKYIYNGLIGSLKPSGDTFSYSNLMNGVKDNPLGWGVYFYDKGRITCCELNGPMGLAYIPWLCVMNSSSGPKINLYNPGAFSFKSPNGQEANLHLHTSFPKNGEVIIDLNLDQPEEFEIALRIPEWSYNTKLFINGKEESVSPGTYKSIKRKWKSKDKITLQLDMTGRLISSPKNDHYKALLYGPIVMARDENRDPNYNQPVEIISKEGKVNVVLEEPNIEFIKVQLKVPTTDGYIRMIDYSSSDNWNGRETCTWLPEKNNPSSNNHQ